MTGLRAQAPSYALLALSRIVLLSFGDRVLSLTKAFPAVDKLVSAAKAISNRDSRLANLETACLRWTATTEAIDSSEAFSEIILHLRSFKVSQCNTIIRASRGNNEQNVVLKVLDKQ